MTASPMDFALKHQAPQQTGDLFGRQVDADQPFDIRGRDGDGGVLVGQRVIIDQPFRQLPTAPFQHAFQAETHADLREGGMHAARQAVAGFGIDAQVFQ